MALSAVFVLVVACAPRGCPDGTTRCGGECVNLHTEPNCGGCGIRCGDNSTCLAALCLCARGFVACAGRCVDPMGDPDHCGNCDIACEWECVGGRCSCAPGMQECDGECVDTASDDGHCGECDMHCASGERCEEGTCVCLTGYTWCGGICVDTASHPDHCGGCGVLCAADEHCVSGRCQCVMGTPCPAGCRDLTSDPDHCGACDADCRIHGAVCEEGHCTPQLQWAVRQHSYSRDSHIGRDTALALAPDGGVYAAFGLGSTGYTTIDVARLDAAGDTVWLRSVAGDHTSAPTAIATRPGEVLVSISDGTLVALRESDGALLFTHAFGTSMDDLATAPDGSVVAVGSFREGLDVGIRTLSSNGHRDIYLLRFDEDGAVTQAHSFGGTADDVRARVAVGPGGDIYLAGHTGNGLDLGGGFLGSGATRFVGSLSSSGEHRWSRRLPIQRVHDIAALPDGVALLGALDLSLPFAGRTLSGISELFVAVWRSTGFERWAVHLGGVTQFGHTGGITYDEGWLYATSGYTGTVTLGPHRVEGTRLSDIFLAKMSATSGAGAWLVRVGGEFNAPYSHAVVVREDTATISGRFDRTVDFGGASLTNQLPGADSFVARYEH